MIPPPALRTRPSLRRWRRGLFWLLGILLFLGLLLVAVGFALTPWAKRTLIQYVSDQSRGRYRLLLDDLDLNLNLGSVRLQGVRLVPQVDSTAWPDSLPRWDIRIRSLQLQRASYWHLWHQGRLHMAAVVLDSLELRLQPARRPPKPDSTDALDRVLQRAVGRTFQGGLQVDKASIRHLTLYLQGTVPQQVDSLDLNLTGLRIDSTAAADTSRLWFARTLELRIRRLTLHSRDSAYRWTVQQVQFRHPAKTLTTGPVQLTPLPAPAMGQPSHPYAQDIYRLVVDSTRATGLRSGHNTRVTRLDLVTLTLYRPRFDVVDDGDARPKNPAPRRYPHETLADLALPLRVGHVHVQNGTISYTQWVPGASAPLRIHFAAIHAHIRNIASNQTLQADIRSQFLGQVPIHLRWSYPLQGTFRTQLTGTVSHFSAPILNPLLRPDRLRINAGAMQRLEFHLQVQHGAARGWLVASYHDLTVSVLDDTGRERPFVSALANLVIRNRNAAPARRTARDTANIAYRRMAQDGMPRFFWQSVKSGLVATLVPQAQPQEPKARHTKPTKSRRVRSPSVRP